MKLMDFKDGRIVVELADGTPAQVRSTKELITPDSATLLMSKAMRDELKGLLRDARIDSLSTSIISNAIGEPGSGVIIKARKKAVFISDKYRFVAEDTDEGVRFEVGTTAKADALPESRRMLITDLMVSLIREATK